MTENQHVQDYENKDEHGEDVDVAGYNNSIDFVGLINIKLKLILYFYFIKRELPVPRPIFNFLSNKCLTSATPLFKLTRQEMLIKLKKF